MTPDERREYYSKETVRPTPQQGQKPIDTFECRQCGRIVEIFDRFDKRTVYCSRACEKKYWRLQSKRLNKGSNVGMSSGMSLQSLIQRERRDLA